jgi:pimeloyl-ACP methyl ester carboxylesterase
MAAFVLVHGAWVGSAGYNSLVQLLRAQGHDVHAPSLTGLGDRAHLLHPGIDLSLHIRDVAGVIDYQRLDEFVLVGHSYGGMVITGVASLYGARIRSLVYLDAFLPDDGQALFDLIPEKERETFLAEQHATPGFVPPRRPEGEPVRSRAAAPHPLLTLTEPLKLSGAERQVRNRTYVLATGTSPPPFQRFYDKAKAGGDPRWRLLTRPTGHGIHAEDPRGTAQLLLDELARS